MAPFVATWLPLILVLAFLLIRTSTLVPKKGQRDLRLALLTLAFLAFAVITSRFAWFEAVLSEKLQYFFRTVKYFLPITGIAPAILALGLAGIVPGVLASVLIGLIQSLILGQSSLYFLASTTFILIFARKYSKPEERGKHTSLTLNIVLAWFETLIYLIIASSVQQLLGGMDSLSTSITNALLIWLTFFLGCLVSIFLIHGLNLFTSWVWNPIGKVRVIGSRRAAIDGAIKQIESLSAGSIDLPVAVQPGSLQELALSQSISTLRTEILTRQENVNKALEVDFNEKSESGLSDAVQSLLKSALSYGADLSRAVVFNVAKGKGKEAIREVYAAGTRENDFSSMDAILWDRIDSEGELLLTDLKAKQYFGIENDILAPKALLAASSKLDESDQLLFWVGFSENHLFGIHEANFYRAIAKRLRSLIRSVKALERSTDQGAWLISALDAISEACFILTSSNRLVFSNTAGSGLLEKFPAIFSEKESPNTELAHFVNSSMNEPSRLSFSLYNRKYQARYFPIRTKNESLGKVINIVESSTLGIEENRRVEFFSNITHDLQAPLKLIRGYLLLINNLGLPLEEQKKYLQKVQVNVDTMEILTQHLLNMERSETDVPLVTTTFDLHELVDEIIAVLKPQADLGKVSISSDWTKVRSPFINADRTLIHEAVFNLLENAIKFSPRNAEVLVTSVKNDDYLSLSFRDHGNGIGPLDQEKVFERFYQIGGAQRKGGGQGLGLAISKAAIEKHGGKLVLDSKLGEGSTFTIVLPLRNAY